MRAFELTTTALLLALAAACGESGSGTAGGARDGGGAGGTGGSSASGGAAGDSSGGSSATGGSAGQAGGGGDPCAALADGTDLSGCVPMYCACADGTVTRSGGGCSNGVGTANCELGCAQHGGSGTPTPVENVYASAECLAYCRFLFGLGCPPGAETSIEGSVSRLCSFLRVAPDPSAVDAGTTTCAEAARQNLQCIVDTAEYTCDSSGFRGPTRCGVVDDVYDDGCAR